MERGIIKENDIYTYRGDLITIKIIREYFTKDFTDRNFFGIKFKDISIEISKDEFRKLYNDKDYAYYWFDTQVFKFINKIPSWGNLSVHHRLVFKVKYLEVEKNDFLIESSSRHGDRKYPIEFLPAKFMRKSLIN